MLKAFCCSYWRLIFEDFSFDKIAFAALCWMSYPLYSHNMVHRFMWSLKNSNFMLKSYKNNIIDLIYHKKLTFPHLYATCQYNFFDILVKLFQITNKFVLKNYGLFYPQKVPKHIKNYRKKP